LKNRSFYVKENSNATKLIVPACMPLPGFLEKPHAGMGTRTGTMSSAVFAGQILS